MTALLHDIPREQIRSSIDRLIHNLVNIKDETGEFLLHLDDGRIIDTKGWAGWEWTHGVGLFGMWRYYEQTGDAKALAIIKQWFEDRFAEGTPTKNINTMAPFITLAYLYEHEPDPRYIPYLDEWAEWLMAPDGLPKTEEGGFQHIVFNDENPGEMWDDTLMMSVLPLAKIGLLLNRPHYIEEAKRQFLVHIKYLFDKKTGLWFHGWSFDGEQNFAKARWARGNSWLTMVIPDFLEVVELPESDPLRRFLVQVLDAQVAALAALQDDSGLWHTLLDDPTSYLEASATAGFAYGILKAVRKGHLDAKYAPTAEKAVQAIIANVSDDGELLQVSFGTGMGSNLDFYRNIPCTSMPYGQAMAILCLAEYRRTYY